MRDNARNINWAFWGFLFVALFSAVAVVIAALIVRQPLPNIQSASSATPNITVYQFQVDANKAWQDTDIEIAFDNQITIQYISGTWTGGIGTGQWYDGKGDLVMSYKCAVEAPDPSACKEPMPNVYNGTLIGRVGDNLFEVGDSLQFTSNRTGNLFLRMNDLDNGLFDNQGSIIVQITVKQSD